MSFWNVFSLLLAIAVPLVLGFCVTSFTLPARFFWLRAALAPGVGVGVCALVFFIFRRPLFVVEALLVAVCSALLWYRRKDFFAGSGISHPSAISLTLLAPAVTVACLAAAIHIGRTPHGDYDGWAIWNWEARLLYRTGSHWKEYLPAAYHGDYPLLVPSTTARFWRYLGGETPELGAVLGVSLAVCSVAVLALVLTELRSRTSGVLLALTLIGTPSYIGWAASQYADIPVGFFFLSVLALIALYFERSLEPHSVRILALAGFLAGCAGWTKNEGIPLIAAAGIGLLFPVIRRTPEPVRRAAAFAAGLAVPLAVLIFFKLTNPVRDYVVAYEPGKLEKALVWDRHLMILDYLGRFMLSFGGWAGLPFIPLLAFILLMGICRPVFASRGWLTIAFVMVSLAASYYFVYLTTPLPLKTHLDSSLDRVLLQLWPSMLLTIGLVTRPASNHSTPDQGGGNQQ
jgi:hypothetical protein